MEKHLTLKDFQIYMETDNFSAGYMDEMDRIQIHLEGCEECQRKLEKYIQNDCLYEEESMTDLLKLLEKEEDIRRKFVIEQLLQMGSMMKPMIRKMLAGEYIASQFSRTKMSLQKSVWRGESQLMEKLSKGFSAHVEGQYVAVEIEGEESKEVVLSSGKGSICGKTEWDEDRKCQVCKLELGENKGEDFYIYVV